MKKYYVYITSNRKDGVLYTGITSNLIKRIWEHKSKNIPGFTKKYNVDKLVHYDVFDDPESAIQREKNIKNWKRGWKIELIEENNPSWEDLYDKLPS